MNQLLEYERSSFVASVGLGGTLVVFSDLIVDGPSYLRFGLLAIFVVSAVIGQHIGWRIHKNKQEANRALGLVAGIVLSVLTLMLANRIH